MDNEDYKIELQNEDIHELEMFADIKEEELVDYDTVDVLDLTGTFRNDNTNIEKYLCFPKDIVGDNVPSKRIPNFYKTDIHNLLKPTYKALLLWEDARALANVTILELFGFDIIKDIWKNLKTNTTLTVVYDSVYQEMGEYTASLINFVICALRFRGILALDISKYMKNRRCIFVSRERLDKQTLVKKIQEQEVIVKTNLLLDIGSKDILYNAFVYNLNSVDRYERATSVMREYNKTIYARERQINDTIPNAKTLYKAGFNLLFTMVSLYHPRIMEQISAFDNDGLEYVWSKLPANQQSNFENLYYSLYNLYDMTSGFTEGNMRLDLMRIKEDINRFYEYIKQYFNSKLDCQACMQLPQDDIVKLLLEQFDIEESIKKTQNDFTQSKPMNDFDDEPIKENESPRSSSYTRQRTAKKETMADKARRRYQEKKDNGDFREMRRNAKKTSKKTAVKVLDFCKDNPKTVITVVGVLFIVWLLFKIIHFIGSIF